MIKQLHEVIHQIEQQWPTQRLLVVGGAGSLEVTPGVTGIDSGHIPAEWLPIAVSHAKVLEQDRHEIRNQDDAQEKEAE